jgi:4-hydroxy-3-methylbut-2-enyl diphosphate reductase
MEIEIDSNSGFCFGVQRAVDMAEKLLSEGKQVYCLGEIVHNKEEVKRLETLGMITISHDDLLKLENAKILIRAHGEPPSTFNTDKSGNTINNGTCPIVYTIQKKIKSAWEEHHKKGGNILIYGKKGHAEVAGLAGQTNNKAIVVSTLADLDAVDFSKPITLFSQTTMDVMKYRGISDEIRKRMVPFFPNDEIPLIIHNTICGHVSNRGEKLKIFAEKHDTIIFVSGLNSSNGKVLYEICKQVNPDSYFVTDTNALQAEWFVNSESVGVCGATSTPRWLMQDIADKIKNLTENNNLNIV